MQCIRHTSAVGTGVKICQCGIDADFKRAEAAKAGADGRASAFQQGSIRDQHGICCELVFAGFQE
ncbi:hypothetical protein D3C74_455780 [compost metagenome]